MSRSVPGESGSDTISIPVPPVLRPGALSEVLHELQSQPETDAAAWPLALRPGAVKTETAVHELGEDFDWTGWTDPEAVVPAVVYLAAQRADGLTGRIVDSTQFGVTWG